MSCSCTYKFWKTEELCEQLIRQARHYDLDAVVFDFIVEAINSSLWNPIEDFDGCTVVQDLHHPYLPCFLHDYAWTTGMGGKEADKIFYKMLKQCGLKSTKARIWYLGVRIGWIFGYRRIHLRKRNVRPFSSGMKAMIDLYCK